MRSEIGRGAQQARSFWRILRSVSVSDVAQEAGRPFALALVGDPESRADALARLYPGDARVTHPALRQYDSTDPEHGFPADAGSYDVVIDAGGGRVAPPSGLPLYSVHDVGGWDRTVERILDDRRDLWVALARRFPGLRGEVSRRIVHETAVANAQLATLNALPGVVPLLGILIPTAMLGDIVLLTKNQAMMLLRLAAAHGRSLDLRDRSRDLAPLLGSAFGWRALARELVALVPGGVGVVARGSIAYAGTYAVGMAAARFYGFGERLTRAQLREMYREALGRSRGVLFSVRRAPSTDRRALPPQSAPEEGRRTDA